LVTDGAGSLLGNVDAGSGMSMSDVTTKESRRQPARPTDRLGRLCYQRRKLVSRGTKAIVTHVESSVGKIKPDCLRGVPPTPAAFHRTEPALRNAAEYGRCLKNIDAAQRTEDVGAKRIALSPAM